MERVVGFYGYGILIVLLNYGFANLILLHQYRDIRASKRANEEISNRNHRTHSVKHIRFCNSPFQLVKQESNGRLAIHDLRMHRQLCTLIESTQHYEPSLRFAIVRTKYLMYAPGCINF